jgi:uncharacterized protein YfaS (alpha-2-macroglobulin family)
MKRGAMLLVITAQLVCGAAAQIPPQGTVQRPRGAPGGTVVVPDQFLRSWDPVTIFFDRPVGKPAGSPEDRPERLVTVAPTHPGAFTWIDEKTLQFRPADAWPPLERFTWAVDGRRVELATLMAAPVETVPASGSEGLDPIETITLSFREPIAPVDLGRMLSIELKPLPGIGAGRSRWLTAEDFEIKAMERSSPSDRATYVLVLRTAIPHATRATVHLRLALDDESPRSFAEISFQTAEPFRVVAVGTRSNRLPVTAEGSRYTEDQAINGGSDPRAVMVELSSPPQEISPVEGRSLVRISPAVDGLEYEVSGSTLQVSGDFAWDTVYSLTITPSPIRDRSGRRLEVKGPSELYLYFPRRPAYLQWCSGQGVIERFGPRMVPIEGRGHERFDLRLYPVGALDRSFWPFPGSPVHLDEAERPPGPGETPQPFTQNRHIREHELRRYLTSLGSPPVSAIVEIPLRREGSSAFFGLDISDHIARQTGSADSPGHFLLGLRSLDAGTDRQWMRVQLTDLSLTTVEEPHAVRFVVTSLATTKPIAGATVTVEAVCDGNWTTVGSGTTGPDGSFRWPAPGGDRCRVMRLHVQHGQDTLVLDPTQAPDGYADNTWSESYETWLQWAMSSHSWRGPQPEKVSHIFTERPVYRPEEPVHIKGYVRLRSEGRLQALHLKKTFVVVEGPGDMEWRFPVELTAEGSFYWKFEADDRPTGDYEAYLEAYDFVSERVSFKLEAYRIPRFEVNLHAPDRTPLDAPFDVSLSATYYAGGSVVDQPVHWRVTQFPYTWRPKGREGSFFSCDGRFSRTDRFETTAALDREDRTDADGSARITLDPTIEPTAQPRSYVIEATVTGADDQTVTGTRRVLALPPFVVGVKVPRYIERAALIEPEIVVVGGDDTLVEGQQLGVRLLHRQWHSYLRASDFSDGEARYTTDVVDEEVFSTTVTSGSEPVVVSMPISSAGVYVVEVEGRDRIGRTQVVAVDLYAGGDEPVTWSKPVSKVFTVVSDRDEYDPGEVVTFVLESPFQQAEVLVIVEAPDGNRYEWLPVRKGNATYRLTVQGSWTPRLPVHFVLMRGRVDGTAPIPGSTVDLGKPATLASTSWIKVRPRDNMLDLKLEYPERGLPGQEIEVALRLADPDGRPLAGEVTLWLVDQAVLALGAEQRLDPLPDLITPVSSHLEVRDTRDLPFGFLPFAENPGGGEAEKSRDGILDRATVRRNFHPVPFFDPRILIGADGVAMVKVQLPDNLTNFKLRAKAVSGLERFGFATGHLAVRLPVIVQPALPRFVRPGDRFSATAIGRIVEGEAGPGAVEIAVEGVVVDGPTRQDFVWVPDRPERLEFPVEVPTPAYDEEGRLERDEVMFRVGVERLSDRATDAFEVRLPIRDDRRRLTDRLLEDLSPGEPIELPDVVGEARSGSIRRSVLISNQPALVRMAAGLNFLLHYPYYCTEQRVSRARAYLAMEKFRQILHMQNTEADFKRAVQDVLEWIPQAIDPSSGLVAYWPGSEGCVSLTAWCLEFLAEAREAGFTVDEGLQNDVVRVLQQALRSDYSRFIDGASYAERCWALYALTRAGRFDPAYAAELARRARYLNLEASALVLQSLVGAGKSTPAAIEELTQKLWDGVIIRLWQDREVYGGLQTTDLETSPLILPSETRSLAEVTRALAASDRDSPRLQVLVNGLVTLGRGDGWGHTNANAAALLALSELLTTAGESGPSHRVRLRLPEGSRDVEITPAEPMAHVVTTTAGKATSTLLDGGGEGPPVVVRAEVSWIPAPDGSLTPADSSGFVVSREMLILRGEDRPLERHPLEAPGTALTLTVGEITEDHVQVVNPVDRYYVAVVVPLASGMEPLNPRLATAPPEATPAGSLTREPTYAAYLDDSVTFYYNTLPKGTYDFYFRARAAVPGRFIQPAAAAELMYDGTVRGNGNGAMMEIEPAAE